MRQHLPNLGLTVLIIVVFRGINGQLERCIGSMKLGPGLVVSQSSTNSNFNDATADSAFDGDEDVCAITDEEVGASWMVDLLAPRWVTRIRIVGYMNTSAIGSSPDPSGNKIPDELKNIAINIGETSPPTWRLITYGGKLQSNIIDISLNDPEGIETRYIQVKNNDGTMRYLQLCEVEVFVRGLENIAINKPVRMSNVATESVAELTVDGSTGSLMCVMSESAQVNTWEIDLGADYLISHVVIYLPVKMESMKLESAIEGSGYLQVGFQRGDLGPVVTFDLGPEIVNRYLRISVEDASLQLCEVEVYAVCQPVCMYEHYDRETHICCDEVILPIEGSSRACCGSTTYDPLCQMCYGDSTVVEMYDTQTHICCDGTVIPMTTDKMCCSGNTSFDAADAIRCNDGIQDRTQNDPADCCHCMDRRLDIAIVASDSVSMSNEDFAELVSYIKNVIGNLKLNDNSGDIRVALESFSDEGRVEFHFNNFTVVEDMFASIDNITRVPGSTQIQKALELAGSEIFEATNGDRAGVPDAMLLITGGSSSPYIGEAIGEASNLRSQGVRIFVVTVGDMVNRFEIINLASLPVDTHTHWIESYEDLSNLAGTIEDELFDECQEHPKAPKCDGIPYHPDEYVCCSDVLLLIENNATRTCCGTLTLFDPTSHVCCGEYALMIETPGVIECCGETSLYNSTSHVCCEGRAVEKTDDNDTECCGNVTFNSVDHICCEDNLVLEKDSGNETECCGNDVAFDPTTEICCHDRFKLTKNSPTDTECCARLTYDPTEYVCCERSSLVRIINPVQTECCGPVLYNSSSELCCPSEERTVPRRNPDTNDCCGSTSFDSETELCCEGNPVSINGKGNPKCCENSSVFDEVNEVCCFGSPVERASAGETMCCSLTVAYDPTTHSCCNGEKVLNQSEPTLACCGTTAFNRDTEGCCDDNAPYNLLLYTCCNDIVQPAFDGHEACCDRTSFDSRCYRCEDETIVPSFDTETEMCCEGNISRKTYQYSCCCGGTLFDSASQVCCDGQVETREAGDTSTCCQCINKKVDIAFAVDYSESVQLMHSDLYLEKFIIDLVNDSDVDTGNIRFALSVFTNEVYNEFFLGNFATKADIIANIEIEPNRQSSTETEAVLQNLMDRVFVPQEGDRPDAPNLAIIITDGRYYDLAATRAKALQTQSSGIHIIVVGVGNLDENGLSQIASEPVDENMFLIHELSELFSIEKLVEDRFIRECPEFPEIALCDEEEFDPSVYVCCETTLLEIIDHNATACCETSSLYDPSSSVCCDGQSVPMEVANPDRTQCCGTDALYNSADEICCDGVAVPINTTNATECCQLQSYDPDSHVCCDGNLVEKFPDSGTSCCGSDFLFDPDSQLCCDDTVRDKRNPDDNACCGVQSSYNSNFEVCCSGNQVNISDYNKTDCCGNQTLYNANVELCCDDSGATVPKRSPTSNACCGMTSYDDEDQICCYGNVLSKGSGEVSLCCGANSVFDPLYMMCCSGQVVLKYHPFSDECCGTIGAFNSGSQICCNDKIVRKDSYSATSCCGLSSYDNKTQICCDENAVVDIQSENATTCCGNANLIDPDTEKCCGGFPIKIKYECCDDTTPFDPNLEVCCSGSVQPIRRFGRTDCCGSESFDTTCRTCDESGTVVIAYDQDTEICCDGEIHDMIYNHSCCCGKRLFDASKYECCYGKIRQKHHADDSLCCHCTNRKVDVAFVVDNSESLTDDHWEQLKDFIDNIITDSNLLEDNAHFALVRFTNEVFNDFYLNTFSSKGDIINHIASLNRTVGGTQTGLALANLVDDVFISNNGDRHNAPNLALIITDGQSNDREDTVTQADRVKSEGIHIIAVGIGLSDTTELNYIATHPARENVFSVSDFDYLFTIEGLIKKLFYEECTDFPRGPSRGPKCGNERFDSEYKLCCNGSIQFRVAGEDTSCCNKISYDPEESICCKSNVLPKIGQDNARCCGEDVYDESEFICCSGNIISRIAGKRTKCCGGKAYNPKKKVCCKDKIRKAHVSGRTACCGEETFDPLCDRCFSGEITPRYDLNSSICCDGNIMKKRFGENSCCCKTRQINLKKELCCNGRALDVPPFSPCACCGKNLYNVKTQVCCNGRRRKKEFGENTQCCRRKIMNIENEMCCGEKVVSVRSDNGRTCCGKRALNPRRELCCNGNVNSIPKGLSRMAVHCCSDDIAVTNLQICCNGVLFHKESTQSSCCGSNVYNPFTDLCSAGQVIQLNTPYSCGDQNYMNVDNVCCAHSLQPVHSRQHTACCAQTSYNIRTSICCSNVLFSKPVDQDWGCCYGKPINPKRHMCCMGNRVRKSSLADDSCCGIQATYNSKYQVCCNGRVQIKRCGEHTMCCNKRSYDPHSHVCCNDVVRKRKHGDLTACCDTNVFNPKLEKCCDGSVIKRDAEDVRRNRKWSKEGNNAALYSMPDDPDEPEDMEDEDENGDNTNYLNAGSEKDFGDDDDDYVEEDDADGSAPISTINKTPRVSCKKRIQGLRRRLQLINNKLKTVTDEETRKKLLTRKTTVKKNIKKCLHRKKPTDNFNNRKQNTDDLQKLKRKIRVLKQRLQKFESPSPRKIKPKRKEDENLTELEKLRKMRRKIRKRISNTSNDRKRNALNKRLGDLIRQIETLKRKTKNDSEPETKDPGKKKQLSELEKLKKKRRKIRKRISNTSDDKKRNLLNKDLGDVVRKIETLKHKNEKNPESKSSAGERAAKQKRKKQKNNDNNAEENEIYNIDAKYPSKDRDPGERKSSRNRQNVLKSLIDKRKKIRKRLSEAKNPNRKQDLKQKLQTLTSKIEKLSPKDKSDENNDETVSYDNNDNVTEKPKQEPERENKKRKSDNSARPKTPPDRKTNKSKDTKDPLDTLLEKRKKLRNRLAEAKNPDRRKDLKAKIQTINSKIEKLTPKDNKDTDRREKANNNNGNTVPYNNDDEVLDKISEKPEEELGQKNKRREKDNSPLDKLLEKKKNLRNRLAEAENPDRRKDLKVKIQTINSKIDNLTPKDNKDTDRRGKANNNNGNTVPYNNDDEVLDKVEKPEEELGRKNKKREKNNSVRPKSSPERKANDNRDTKDPIDALLEKRKKLRNRLVEAKNPDRRNDLKNKIQNINSKIAKLSPTGDKSTKKKENVGDDDDGMIPYLKEEDVFEKPDKMSEEESRPSELEQLEKKQRNIRKRISNTSDDNKRNIFNKKLGDVLSKIEAIKDKTDKSSENKPGRKNDGKDSLETLLDKRNKLRNRLSEAKTPDRRDDLKNKIEMLDSKIKELNSKDDKNADRNENANSEEISSYDNGNDQRERPKDRNRKTQERPNKKSRNDNNPPAEIDMPEKQTQSHNEKPEGLPQSYEEMNNRAADKAMKPDEEREQINDDNDRVDNLREKRNKLLNRLSDTKNPERQDDLQNKIGVVDSKISDLTANREDKNKKKPSERRRKPENTDDVDGIMYSDLDDKSDGSVENTDANDDSDLEDKRNALRNRLSETKNPTRREQLKDKIARISKILEERNQEKSTPDDDEETKMDKGKRIGKKKQVKIHEQMYR